MGGDGALWASRFVGVEWFFNCMGSRLLDELP